MHHAVQESPKQDIGEEAPNKASGEQEPPWLEAFVPSSTSFEDEEHRQKEGGEEVEDEAIQACEAQDARGGSG